jgi:hypothetical protein
MRANWEGLVAGTDDSVDESSERMGAGYAIGDGHIPIRAFSAPVGGPLASIRPEAASLLQILRDVAANYDSRTPLLITGMVQGTICCDQETNPLPRPAPSILS